MNGKPSFYYTFIYGFNERAKREGLWEDRKQFKVDEPWIMCGDFNYVMHTDERIGSHIKESDMRDMKLCMAYCGMNDIQSTYNFFTWSNKQQGNLRVFLKLYIIMANQQWQPIFNTAGVSFV